MKKKKKKYTIYPIELFYLLLISVAVFFAPNIFSFAKNLIPSSSLEMKKIMEIEIEEGTKTKQGFRIKDKLMIQSGEKLYCYDKTGEQEWVRPLKSEKTEILKWGDNYLISDLNSGRIANVNAKNEVIAEKNVKGKIADFCVSKEKLFVLLDGENKILILDTSLKESAKIEHKHSDIIKIACDYESSELILYTSSIETGELKTFCIVYDEKGEIVASLDLNGALIFDIFVEDNIVMISDENFSVFSRIVRPIAEMTYSTELIDADFKNSRLFTISKISEGDAGEKELSLYDSGLKRTNSIIVPESTDRVVAGELYLISASNRRITLMNTALKTMQVINLSDEVSEIKWVSEDSFYIVSKNRLILYANR